MVYGRLGCSTLIPLPSVAGVQIRIHGLLPALLLLAWIFGLGQDALLLLLLLLSHELAHVLFAHAFGLRLRSLRLLPIGGAMDLDGLERADPAVEVAVAMAGPLHNLVLLAVGFLLQVTGVLAPRTGAFFMLANASLSLGNLLPALPLDGGRVVQALIATQRGFVQASQTVELLGKITIWVLILLSAAALFRGWIFVGPLLFAIFIAMRGSQEGRASRLRGLRTLWQWPGNELTDAVPVQGIAVPEQFPLHKLAGRLLPHRYHIVWVVRRGGHADGPWNEADVWQALQTRGPDARAADLRR